MSDTLEATIGAVYLDGGFERAREYIYKHILKDIENYIREYCKSSEVSVDFKEIAEKIVEETTLREKLQDSLILLNDIKGPIELVIMIKQKIKEIKYNEDHRR